MKEEKRIFVIYPDSVDFCQEVDYDNGEIFPDDVSDERFVELSNIDYSVGELVHALNEEQVSDQSYFRALPAKIDFRIGAPKTMAILFANFLRENFYVDGGPDYIPYDRTVYTRGNVDACWGQFNKIINWP